MSDPRIQVKGGILNEKEEEEVLKVIDKYTDVDFVEVVVNGDFIGIKTYRKAPFKRIRRITGYLVGDLSRFNNAKLAEVNQRIKHGTGD